MLILDDLLYTEEHLWVKALETARVCIGLTDYGQSLLGDISTLDIPSQGDEFTEGDLIATAQGVDGDIREISTPVSGTVTLINQDVLSSPDIVSEDPYEAGWLLEMKLEQPRELDDLMSPEDYEIYVREQKLLEEEMPDEDIEDVLEVIET